MSQFSDEMIAVAKELLTEFGMPVVVSRNAVSGFNPTTLKPNTSAVSFAGLAASFDPSNSALTGYEKNLVSDDVKTHKWFILQSDSPVLTGDFITAPSGAKFLVNASTEIDVGEITVYNRVATTKVS